MRFLGNIEAKTDSNEQSIKFIGMGDSIEIWSVQEEIPIEQEEFSKTLEEIMTFNPKEKE